MTLPRLALLSTILAASLLIACGDSGGSDPDAGENVDSSVAYDAALYDAPVAAADAADYDGGSTTECFGLGVACTAADQCCSDLCEQDSLGDLVCQPGGSCKGDTEVCETAAQCCSLYCDDGLCATGGICEPEAGTCAANSDCCGNNCDVGDTLLCLGTDASCQAVGDSCNTPGNCCSGRCEEVATDDLRCLPIGPCGSAGEVCADGDDCCSGLCEDGLCPFLGACTTVFEPCEGGGECCSGICADPGTGYDVCLYVGGCTPMKELCTTDTQCCSGACISDDGGLSMRCEDPAGCLDDGEICGYAASNNCCSEGSTACLPTSIGVSRCLHSSTECIPVTGECSSSDECCEGVCAPAPVTGILVCNPDCIPQGGGCTTDADCCDLQCTNFVCAPPDDPCIPLGAGPCTDTAECCDGECGANPADPDGDWICRYIID